MKFVAISDTHGYHDKINLPPGDVLIHAGDITKDGTEAEVLNFLSWFSQLEFQYKIFISGNHDLFIEEADAATLARIIPKNVIYLNDSGIVINGIKIWGSPVQPCYYNMAFNRERGDEIQEHWNLIPHDTDILVTHGPAYGVLDENFEDENVGCKDLLHRLLEIKPKYFVFGHIHECFGMTENKGIRFINACVLDRKYNLVNNPVAFSYAGLQLKEI